MPKFGLAHKLLSSRHPDTSPPAGGADPDDGQVVTWSDALKAWRAADAAGGVTDHGDLTGLVPDDDHTQYALANKTRPNPWITAADFAARSIADLGTKDHDLLAGLTDDDHSIYALLAGRSGGQSFIGGSGSGEHLTLQSTAHATRGYVRAQDDLQLLSNILRDSGGTNRLTLGTASPHLTLTGDVRATGHLGLGADGAVSALSMLKAYETFTAGPTVSGLDIYPQGTPASGGLSVLGLQGIAQNNSPGYADYTRGLGFIGRHATPGGQTALQGLYLSTEIFANMGALLYSMGGYLFAAYGANTSVATAYGLWLRNFGHAQVGTAYGFKIDNQANAAVNINLEVGPTTPYLRVEGGSAPAGVNSSVGVCFGGTLYRLTRNAGTGAVETAAM